MRTIFAVITVTCTLSLSAQTPADADGLLQRGHEHFRAARYAQAATDLAAAAQAFLSADEMQSYVRTGRFERLPQFETALIYLALAQSRLGNEAAAREAVLRLVTAERIEPTYTRLPLDADAAEFETLAPRLVPDINLGANVQLARAAGTTATPRVAVATPPPQPAPAVPEPERVRLVEQIIAQDCARIQREADERVAAARREAEEKIAAAERAAEQRVAEIQRSADQRVASAEAAAKRATERMAELSREPAPPSVQPPPPSVRRPVESMTGDSAAALRRANDFAAAGRNAEANEIYTRLANSDASRAVRAEAAVGLYRTSAYSRAVDAFERLAPFVRGEEDLRYYNAVSLYETGRYADAQRELACALPFIRVTEEVIRYRTKIEQTVAWQMARPAAGESH